MFLIACVVLGYATRDSSRIIASDAGRQQNMRSQCRTCKRRPKLSGYPLISVSEVYGLIAGGCNAISIQSIGVCSFCEFASGADVPLAEFGSESG